MDTNGLVDKNIISDEPFLFSEGRAIISQDGLKVIIDKSGKEYFRGHLDEHYASSEGLILCKVNELYSYIDLNGKTVIGPMNEKCQPFSEGLAIFSQGNKQGFINTKGEKVIPAEYSSASDFSDGFASVRKNHAFYYIDQSGKTKLGPYSSAYDFVDGVAAVIDEIDFIFIDKTGKQLFDETYHNVRNFRNGYTVVFQKNLESHNPIILKLIGENGSIHTSEAKQAYSFQNGYSIAQSKKDRMGYIKTDGKWAFEPRFDKVTNYSPIK